MSAVKRTRQGMAHLVVCLLGVFLTATVSSPVAAQQETGQRPNAGSAIPLADALRRFANESGYDVVFPERLVEGKLAAPVREAANAQDALRQILAGSGLVPRFTRPDAFVLESVTTQYSADLSLKRIEVLTSPLGEQDSQYRWYGEKLLNTSLAVLRRSRELGFKAYDFTLYVWLSSDGKIIDLEGYGGADHQEALSIAKEMLLDLAVGTVPPPNMPQPVGLRITAQ